MIIKEGTITVMIYIIMEKPRRPLSSFNLFYRYKRSLLAGLGDVPEETIKSIISCPAGLEDDLLQSSSSLSQRKQPLRNPKDKNNDTKPSSPKTNEESRRDRIRTALDGKILPSDTTKKRRHRKAVNGPSLSFVQMGRMMTESWKSVDPFAKQVFDDLAVEGKEFYKNSLKEYGQLSNLGGDEDVIVGGKEREKCGGDDEVTTSQTPTMTDNDDSTKSKKKKKKKEKMRQKNDKKVPLHKIPRCVKSSPPSSTLMITNNNDPAPIKSMMKNDIIYTRGSTMQPLEVEFGTSTCDPFSQSSDSGRSLLSDVQRRQMNTQQHCFQQQQQKQQHDEQQQLQQHHEDDHGVHFKTTDSAFQDPFDSFHPINLDGYDSSSSFGAVLPSKGKSE